MAAGDNPFGDEEETIDVDEEEKQEVSLADEFDWQVLFRKNAVSSVKSWATQFGWPQFAMEAFVRDNIDAAINYMTNQQGIRRPRGPGDERFTGRESASEFNRLWNDGMVFFSRTSGLNFDGLGSTRGSGSGSRGPTAGEIRQMFDEDQLTEQASKMWGAYLVEDAPDARGLAKGYINAVVASGGEQQLDFQTFILNKIRATNRHKVVYRGKPEGMDELQYIQPYTQSAMSAIGGGGQAGSTVNDVVTAGGALGASAQSFNARLARTPQQTGTKSFIGGIEQQVRDVKNILRG